MQTIAEILSKELNETLPHVQNVIELLDGGNTVPFIARYRKELHGSMDDQQIRRLADRLTYLRNLDARRSEIKQSIASQEKLTDELSSKLDSAATLAELEDLYRPYKPKRTTRASIAKEKGLMPLAAKLLMQEPAADPVKLAEKYVNPGKGVNTPDEALSGARDIIAERLSDSADIRRYIKELAHRSGTLTALKAAAMAGVDVRIIFPQKSDHATVHEASLSYLEELMRLGAKVYFYQKGFIHSKMLLVDDETASVGTANMDIRSFMLNSEINAFIYDNETVGRLYRVFADDLTDCRQAKKAEVTQKFLPQRIWRSVCRLFSPVL